MVRRVRSRRSDQNVNRADFGYRRGNFQRICDIEMDDAAPENPVKSPAFMSWPDDGTHPGE